MHFKRVAQVSPLDTPGGASPRPTATITSAIDSSSAVVVILYSPSNGLPGSSSTISTILPLSSPTITSTITTASTTSTTKEVLAATNATNASSTSLQSSLVLLGSTTSALINTSTSSKSAAAATGSAAAQSVKKSSNSGLVAGVAVLGALLGLTLVALIYLILRRRRTKDQRGEYRPTFESKNIQNSPTASLENTINSLETQLHERDVQLRESQAILLQKGRSIGGSSLDDRQVNERFSRLSKIINDWVLTHFKKMHTGVSPARDVDSILQKSQPDYAILLGEPRTRYLVIRSLVAEVLVQAFNTEELIGNPALSELKQAIGVKSSTAEANDWRAQTMTLLEQSPTYRNDRASAVVEVSKRIDDMTSNLAGLGYSEARLRQLSQVVEAAASLAMDLAKQRVLFRLYMTIAGATEFDAATMEDVLQDHKAEGLQGRLIRGIVFPAVKKWGDDSGNEFERAQTIFKAQVLV